MAVKLVGILNQDNYDMCDEFCTVFDPLFRMPVEKRSKHIKTKRFLELRASLITEEACEFAVALKTNDMPEALDAIVDVAYILMGTAFLKRIKLHDMGKHSVTHKWCLKLLEFYEAFCLQFNVDEKFLNETLDELFSLVHHKGNMTKLDQNKNVIINDGIMRPDLPVGKILKPEGWRFPQEEFDSIVANKLKEWKESQ